MLRRDALKIIGGAVFLPALPAQKEPKKVGLLTIDTEDMDTRIIKSLITSDSEEAMQEQYDVMSEEYDLVTLIEQNSVFKLKNLRTTKVFA